MQASDFRENVRNDGDIWLPAAQHNDFLVEAVPQTGNPLPQHPTGSSEGKLGRGYARRSIARAWRRQRPCDGSALEGSSLARCRDGGGGSGDVHGSDPRPRAGMSRSSKVVLGLSVLLTAATVAGVHLKQRQDRQRLRDGVIRDIERQNQKKENIRLLGEQIILTKQLEAEREKMMKKGSPNT
ncbi:hypothetical protein STEG23_031161 [Scotinomys teguina]